MSVNPFLPNVPFWSPWKHQKTWFSDIFREIKREHWEEKGLCCSGVLINDFQLLKSPAGSKTITGFFYEVFCNILTSKRFSEYLWKAAFNRTLSMSAWFPTEVCASHSRSIFKSTIVGISEYFEFSDICRNFQTVVVVFLEI